MDKFLLQKLFSQSLLNQFKMNIRQHEKSTTRQDVKLAIHKYIVDSIDTSDYKGHDGTLKTSLEIIAKEAKEIAFAPYEMKKYKTYQEAFKQWVLGMPGLLNFEVYYPEILLIMEGWGLPQPDGKDTEDSANLFYALLYRELLNIYKKNKLSLVPKP